MAYTRFLLEYDIRFHKKPDLYYVGETLQVQLTYKYYVIYFL